MVIQTSILKFTEQKSGILGTVFDLINFKSPISTHQSKFLCTPTLLL